MNSINSKNLWFMVLLILIVIVVFGYTVFSGNFDVPITMELPK